MKCVLSHAISFVDSNHFLFFSGTDMKLLLCTSGMAMIHINTPQKMYVERGNAS